MLLSAEADASQFPNLSNNNSHDGPAGCFCSLRAEPPMQRPRPQHKQLQQPAGTSPRPLPPALLPSCSQPQRARGHLQFPPSDTGTPGCSLRRGAPKTIPRLPDGFHFTRLLRSALCCKSCSQTSRYASGYHQQQNLQSWLP